jgi:flagellar assembly protein FliH
VSGLTLEQVLAWLEFRDERTRARLAACLAGDIEQLRLAAAREGHAVGEARGLKDAQAQTATALGLIRRAAQEAEVSLRKEAAQLADSCADIVIEVLTRMAGDALARREAVLPLARELLKRVAGEREVVVKVSAQDLPLLAAGEEALRAAFGGRKLALAADPRIDLGGCVLETRLGSLDGRLETQLRAVFEAIHAARSAREERG